MKFDEIGAKVLQNLHGIIPLNDCPERIDMTSVINRISDPPSYYVYLTLIEACKYPKQYTHEKSVWRTCVSYNDTIFCIEDWKRYTWSILTLRKSDVSVKFANELYEKIASASHILIKMYEKEYDVYVRNSEFFIPNNVNKIQSMYDFYFNKTKNCLQSLRSKTRVIDRKIPEDILSAVLNKIDEKHRQLSYFTSATIVFFFSYIELILGTSFALLKCEDANYIGFKEKTFKERFKYIFDVSRSKDLAEIYNNILRLKEYRDSMAHGFGDKEILLVELPRMGLVPVSWEKSRTSIAAEYIPFDEENAKWICNVMQAVEKWLNTCEPTQMVLLYLESGFPIPIAEKRRKEIVHHMIDYQSFKAYLVDMSYAQDAYEDSYYPF